MRPTYCDLQKKFWALLLNFNRDQIRDKILSAVQNNLDARSAGNPDGVQAIPDREQLEKQFTIERQAVREKLRISSTACKPVVTEFARRFQDACRALASNALKSESAECNALGIGFKPSAKLEALIAAGYDGETTIDRSYHPTPATDPADFLHGLLKSNDAN